MDLIRLELQGFGSFVKREVIDFSDMKGLWLVTGETGAGKTTIFDAIVFALFGETSGSSRMKNNTSMGLRSDYVDDSFEAYVQLDFLQDGQPWQVKRWPAWQKAGKKTPEQEKVELTGQHETLSKLREADERLQAILRVDVDQFRQLAMIAQNDFEKLVLEDSKDRSIVLRKLLNTEKYERFQNLVKKNRNDAEASRKLCLDSLKKEASAFSWDLLSSQEIKVSNFLSDPSAATYLVDEDLLNAMELQLKREQQAITAARQTLEPVKAQITELNRQLGAARDLHEQFFRLEKLAADVEKDKNYQPAAAEKKKKLQRQQIALSLKPALDNRADARNRKAKAENLKIAAEATLQEKAAALNNALKAASVIETLEQDLIALQKENALADSKLPAFSRLHEKEEELAEAEGRYSLVHKTMTQLREQEQQLRSQAETARRDAARCSELQELLTHEKAALQQLQELITKLHALRQDEERQPILTRQTEERRSLAGSSLKTYEEAHLVYINSQRSLLCRELVPGLPCPICGSTEHPAPYQPGQNEHLNSCSAETLEELRKKYEQDQQAYQGSQADLHSLQDSITRQRDILGLTEADQTEALLTAKKKEQKELSLQIADQEAEKRTIQGAGEMVQQLQKELDDLQPKILDAAEREKDALAAAEAARSACETIRKEMPPEGEAALRQRIQVITEEVEAGNRQIDSLRQSLADSEKAHTRAVSDAENAERALLTADQEKAQADQAFIQALSEAGFGTEQDLHSLMPESQESLNQQSERITRWETECQGRQDQLQELSSQLEGKTDVDPEQISGQISELEARLHQRETEIQQQQEASQSNRTTAQRTASALKEWKAAHDQAQFYNTLYDTVIGGKGKNESFEIYLQRYYFHRVVRSANLRFVPMTGHMFELRLSPNGLDLNVMDYQTGRERPVTSLSGGEKFKAALSMALGMSDMIRSEVRNVDLGMLFIDEGFGTLDAGSIDLAIDILRQLSSDTGRLVSVISHREEMQAGIEQKLYVRKHRSGSAEKGSYLIWDA